MSYFERHVVTLEMDTSTAGTGSAYTNDPVNGCIHAIRYIHNSDNPLSTTCHLQITGEVTGMPILGVIPDFTGTGESKTYYPRVDVCDTTAGYNNYSTLASASDRVKDRVGLAKERIKLEITTSSSTGDNVGSGTFHILVGG
jgi:hypothetical protein